MKSYRIEGMMRLRLFAVCHLVVVISVPAEVAYAEGGDPTTLEFRMIGDNSRVYDVLLKSHISKGMMLTLAGKKGKWTTAYGFARYWTKPVCIDHSKEIGQLAVVRYLLGGGTGVAVSRYMILRGHRGTIECIGRGDDDGHEWSRASVGQSYRIRTAFEGDDDGLIRRISISIPKDGRMEQHVEVAEYTVYYKVSRSNEAFELRPHVDRRDAVCLIGLLGNQRSRIRERAADEIGLLWPSCREQVQLLLKARGNKTRRRATMRVKKIVLSHYDKS